MAGPLGRSTHNSRRGAMGEQAEGLSVSSRGRASLRATPPVTATPLAHAEGVPVARQDTQRARFQRAASNARPAGASLAPSVLAYPQYMRKRTNAHASGLRSEETRARQAASCRAGTARRLLSPRGCRGRQATGIVNACSDVSSRQIAYSRGIPPEARP